jgi:hypothetical protein
VHRGFEVSGNAALSRSKWKVTRLAPLLGDIAWRRFDQAFVAILCLALWALRGI